ncbi:hypothetical protein DL89DRAFT_23819 [Linderina pennispora]|uniref:Uncharacterized protein n=1 Tax=Linderina pennispora TaxID=61395 RepID=A0A1Y1WMW1_9FUNG|nr:uncharacterized protein DL89DRAFT_23819 [Linderina pennispora]ORX74863.1 hypothetical protein DL89DRAFT_23819 [Linderina pennispora]
MLSASALPVHMPRSKSSERILEALEACFSIVPKIGLQCTCSHPRGSLHSRSTPMSGCAGRSCSQSPYCFLLFLSKMGRDAVSNLGNTIIGMCECV